MMLYIRNHSDEQFWHDLHGLDVVSEEPRPSLFDISTNSRVSYDGVFTDEPVVEMWSWSKWESVYATYQFCDSEDGLELAIEHTLNPAIVENTSRSVQCVQCGKQEYQARMQMIRLKRTHTEFLVCRDHVEWVLRNGVINEDDRMWYEVELYEEYKADMLDTLEDTLSIRE
jgi:hypothetical protein